jgi:signal transduction histidine kinase
LGQALTAQLDVDEVLDEAYRGASRLVDTTSFYVAFYDPDKDEVIFALDVEEGKVRRNYAARKAGHGLTEHILRSRAPLLIQEDLPKHGEELGIQQFGPAALSWLGVPLMIGDQVLGVMAVQSYTTPRAYDEHDQNLLTSIASQAAIAIQNARLFEETERRRQDLQALYSADEQLYRYLDLDQVLQSLVDVAVDILQADKSSLIVWDEGHERLVVRAARGFSPETIAQMVFAPGEGTVGRVAVSGQAAIVEDTHTDPHVARRITDPENIRSFMHVPIEIKGQIFGVFNADYAEPRAFGQDEVRLFTSLAQRAALAIQNAQLYEQAQELAAVHERQRLARDLHDAVTQTLFSASLIAESVPDLWKLNPQRGQEMLDKVRQLSRGALAEMRTLLIELRPARLLEADLPTLLRQLAQAASGREGIPVHVTVKGECDLPADVHIVIYRIAQEALNNVVKHAQAQKVEVSLECRSDPGLCALLRIRDDGCGFDASDVSADHMGLGIMRERARSIGTTLQVESEAGQGCQVSLLWTEGNGGGTNG